MNNFPANLQVNETNKKLTGLAHFYCIEEYEKTKKYLRGYPRERMALA